MRRRSVLAAGGVIASGGLLSGVAGATHETEWNPNVDITHDGLGVRVETEDDPDSVTIYTADGTAHEFGAIRRGGYHFAEEGHIDDGWYGPIERVEAVRGNRTVVVESDVESTLDVTCSLWRTPNERPSDFRMYYENAHKWYDGPVGDEPVYGSPGRKLQAVQDKSNELEINFDNQRDCSPEGDVAVVFDCTSVTVHPEEFVNGNEEIYHPKLTFADGSSQLLAEGDEMFEPPHTFEGTGEHEGKIIEHLNIWNDATGSAMFTYTNPDVDSCGSGSQPSQQEESSSDASSEPESSESVESSAEGSTETPTETDSPTTDQTATEEPAATSTATPNDSSGSTSGDSSGSTSGDSSSSASSDTSASSSDGTSTSGDTTTDAPTETSNGTSDQNDALERVSDSVVDGSGDGLSDTEPEGRGWFGALAGVSSIGGAAYLASRFRRS